jgi:hypothetical protein
MGIILTGETGEVIKGISMTLKPYKVSPERGNQKEADAVINILKGDPIKALIDVTERDL